MESRNFEIRKNVLQYDDVMNQQREIIYGQRREVLEGGDMRQRIRDMRESLITEAVDRAVGDEGNSDTWDMASLTEQLEKLCIDKGGVARAFDTLIDKNKKTFVEALMEESDALYEKREKMWTDAGLDMREIERASLLNAVDRRWMDHIDAMSELRDGIGLRAYGQRNPVIEYKMEGYEMFEEMVRLIQEDTVRRVNFTVLTRPVVRREAAVPTQASHGAPEVKRASRPAQTDKKVGRNDPCPCGSGKKYKNCCGREG